MFNVNKKDNNEKEPKQPKDDRDLFANSDHEQIQKKIRNIK